MTGPLVCEMIEDYETFAAAEPEWWALWRSTPRTTPFQSPAWLLPWSKAFAAERLRVLSIRHCGRLVALAPFACETPARRLLLLGDPITDYHDVLLAPELEKPALAALTQHLQAAAWDVCELPELPPDANALGLGAPQGCEDGRETGSACPVLALPTEVDDLPRCLPVRKRRAISNAWNRAARRGSVEIVDAGQDFAAEAVEMLVRLHGARWQSRGEAGVLADAGVRRFHREVLPRMLIAGLARFHLLRIGGRAAAAYYGFHHRHRAYAYLSGFDPDYAFESPGVILFSHAIVEAVRDGATEFHFLRGREPYKYGWGATDRWNTSRVFRRRRVHVASA